MTGIRSFTAKQVTAMVIAICAAVVLVPVGATAVTGSTAIMIADPAHPARKAHVTSTGRLATAPCDGNSCAAVDGAALRVGGTVAVTDGGDSVTVDGTLRPGAPAAPWTSSFTYDGSTGLQRPLAGPSATPIELSSLSVGVNRADVGLDVLVFGAVVPGSATTCTPLSQQHQVWDLFIPAGQLVTSPFPSPIEVSAPTGSKVCLMISVGSGLGLAHINANGFFAD
jgi:hypothetical protein